MSFAAPACVGPLSICIPDSKRDIFIIGCRFGKGTDKMNYDEDHNDSNIGDHYTWPTEQHQGMGCNAWDEQGS